MRRSVGECWIELVQGNIVEETTDAIVNAANVDLAGGGGVDGAIHAAAGPSVMDETDRRYPDGCPTGNAVASSAGNLSAEYIFHAVGPVWAGGRSGEAEQLASAYRSCLDLAVEHECESIAFPAISTGIYGYPKDLAAEVALSTCLRFLKEHTRPALLRFVLFDGGSYGTFAATLERLTDAEELDD